MTNQERFFQAIWGNDESLHHSIWFGKKAPNKVLWDFDPQKLHLETHKLAKLNIYHTPALFSERKRGKRTVAKVKCCWLDIDTKGTPFEGDLKGILRDTVSKLKGTLFDRPYWIIFTGGGFHLYWVFDRYLNPDQWKKIAKLLHQVCLNKKIYADSVRTQDASSLMRLPSSSNMKGKPILTKILKEGQPFNPFEIIARVEQEVQYDKSDFEMNNQAADLGYLKADAEVVASKCAVIRQFKENGWESSEPAWNAAICVVANCKDGFEKCHEWSSKADNYNEAETTEKINYKLKGEVGPTLCETFEQFGLCESCQHKGKIKSPIQLGVTVSPIEETTKGINDVLEKSRAQELIALVPGSPWQVGKEGIYKLVDDIPILLCETPFYIIDLISEDFLDETLLTAVIRAFPTTKPYIDFKLPFKFLSEDNKLLAEFFGRAIFPRNKKQLKEYLTTYFTSLQHIKPHKAVTSLGWQKDDSFVYNSKGEGFTVDMKSLICVSDRKMRGYCSGFETQGSLKNWQQVIEIYKSHPHFMPHLFSLLCALGAPLLYFTAAKGFILSLQGATGTGKTLGHKIALSIWGNPETAGVLGTHDTHTALLGRMGAVKNLPLRMDEITTIPTQQLTGLVYELVNGRGRSRATIDGSLSNTSAEWQTVTLVNTNAPLLENEMLIISEAERCRILELSVKMPPDIIKKGHLLGEIVTKNYGLVGIPFIQAVITHKPKMLQILNSYYKKFQKYVTDDKRFWVSCGAVAFTAAAFAKTLNLIDIDLTTCLNWFETILLDQTSLNQDFIRESRGFETQEEFISALKDYLTGHILYINQDGIEIKEPTKEVKARIERLDSKESYLYVRTNIFNEFVRKYYIDSVKKVRMDLGIEEAKAKRFRYEVVRCYKFKV